MPWCGAFLTSLRQMLKAIASSTASPPSRYAHRIIPKIFISFSFASVRYAHLLQWPLPICRARLHGVCARPLLPCRPLHGLQIRLLSCACALPRKVSYAAMQFPRYRPHFAERKPLGVCHPVFKSPDAYGMFRPAFALHCVSFLMPPSFLR